MADSTRQTLSEGLPESAAPSVPTADQKLLLEWFASLGGEIAEGVHVHDDPAKGQHLRVDPDRGIENGTCVVKCPIMATMSCLNLDPPLPDFPQHSFVYNQQFIDSVGSEVAMAFFLMDQYLQENESFWAPYIRNLPSPNMFTTTQYYDEEDLKWIEGTNLEASREKLLMDWRAAYSQGLTLLRAAGNPAVPSYSWDRFMWAFTIFCSRGFSSRVLAGYGGKPFKANDEFSVLVPLADFANHQPLSKIEWSAEIDSVGLKVLEDLQPGVEVNNNYGAKNNDSLLMSYGFCMGDNLCDYRRVNLKAPAGSPLSDARLEQSRKFPGHKDDERGVNYFIFNAFWPFTEGSRRVEECIFSRDLLDAVTILAANPREIGTMELAPNRVHIPTSAYGTSRSLLNGLSQIQFELVGQALRAMRGGYLEKAPRNTKQRNAQIYREAQLMHFQNALVVSSWTLTRARADVTIQQKEKLLDAHLSWVPENKFGLPIRSQLKSLVHNHHSLLKHDGELFKGRSVLHALPRETAACLDTFFEKLTPATTPVFRESELPVSEDMVTYCIFILFCVATHRNLARPRYDATLGSRITRWVPYILGYYPEPVPGQELIVEDSDVDYLLTEIHHALELLRGKHIEDFEPIEAFTGAWLGDEGWLSRSAFRWAWYLAEDEIVQVPRTRGVGELDIQEMQGDWYFYIPYTATREERH